MALDEARHEVVLFLAQTNEAIREAREKLETGGDYEKVAAAGELDFLQRQKSRLRLRLAQVEQRMAEHKTLFWWFRQFWFSLMLHFESWIAHG